MNAVFTVIVITGLIMILISSPQKALPSLIAGSSSGLSFALKLFPIYAVWLAILNIWNRLHFDEFLAKKSKSILKKIFPGESNGCYNHLAVNLSANVLGMGSAGTPAGMNAISEMKQRKNKAMLLVINSTSIQLIPTTVVALRSTMGAATDIILPTLLSTLVTTVIGYVLVKIFVK